MKKGYKECPFCGEEIRQISTECPFCGEGLKEIGYSTNNKISFKGIENNGKKSGDSGIIVPIILLIGIILFLISFLLYWNKTETLDNQIRNLKLENDKLQEQIIELSTEKEITQNIGDWTCKGKGINGKIQGFASCSRGDGGEYEGDILNNRFIGKGTKKNVDGDIQEGYFYDGYLVAGKVTKSNGNAFKGLWGKMDENTIILEFGKTFLKNNGKMELGEFKDGKLSYGFIESSLPGIGKGFIVGTFNGNGLPYNGYFNIDDGCFKFTNGNMTENTRTITNTVYRDSGLNLSNSNVFGDLYSLGGKFNPYTVNLNIQ